MKIPSSLPPSDGANTPPPLRAKSNDTEIKATIITVSEPGVEAIAIHAMKKFESPRNKKDSTPRAATSIPREIAKTVVKASKFKPSFGV